MKTAPKAQIRAVCSLAQLLDVSKILTPTYQVGRPLPSPNDLFTNRTVKAGGRNVVFVVTKLNTKSEKET